MGTAVTVGNTTIPITAEAVAEWNASFRDLLTLKIGTLFHAGTRAAVTGTPANTSTCYALAVAAKTALNLHYASVVDATTGIGEHIASTTAIATADPSSATDIDGTCTLLNAVKTSYNTHRAAAGKHPTADTTNNVTAAAAASYDDLVALTNQEYTKHNAHLTQAGKHVANDATNTASSSTSSDLATSLTRVNDLATKYTAHLSQTDDTDICTLVNNLHVQYEAHRVLVTGSVHLHADSTNADGSAVSATNLATAITRLNLIVTAYEAHRVLVGTGGSQVHLAADSTDSIAATHPATDRTTCVALANDLRAKFIAHEANVVAHTIADGTDTVTAVVCVGHCHKVDDAVDVLTATNPATDLTTGIALANDLRSKYNTHIASTTYHVAADATNPVTVAVAAEYTTAVVLALDINAQINAHFASAMATNPIIIGAC